MPYLFKNLGTKTGKKTGTKTGLRPKTGKIRENDSEIDLFDPISKKKSGCFI